MKDKATGFSIAMVYIGTLIGAGFASGQELLQFFARFGIFGLAGIATAGVLFAAIGYMVLRASRRLGAKSPESLIISYKIKPLRILLGMLTALFLFALIVVMLAGSGALFSEVYGKSNWIGSTAMTVLAFFTAITGKSGIIRSFRISVPFLVFGMTAIAVFSLINADFNTPAVYPNNYSGSWFISTILFVSYNMIAAISVLVPLGRETDTKSAALSGALIGGLLLGTTGLLAVLAIIFSSQKLEGIEVPIVRLASLLSERIGRTYSLFLLVGIYTTVVGCLFALQEKLRGHIRIDVRIISLIILGAALLLSNIGFSTLISFVYPISGYLGIIMLAGIIFRLLKNK